jgi:hypothetical protein
MRQRAFVVEHLAKVTTIDPAAARFALVEVVGFGYTVGLEIL